MKEILHLRPYLRRCRKDLIFGGGALVLTNFFTLLAPWVTKYAIDDITRGASASKFQMYALLLVGLAIV